MKDNEGNEGNEGNERYNGSTSAREKCIMQIALMHYANREM